MPLDTINYGDAPHAPEQTTTIPSETQRSDHDDSGPSPDGLATSLGPSLKDDHNPKRARLNATQDIEDVWREGEKP